MPARSKPPPKRRQRTAADDERRWAAVVARDAAADGTFVYSVASTGVYCRPSCASRQARRENVRFHAAPADAEAAGFRPCKRCRPRDASQADRHARIVADACRAIEAAETPPSLAALAEAAGLSPFHFHRLFRDIAGMTPKAYATAHRRKRVRARLAEGGSVTTALHDAGFGSAAGFYADSGAALGMAPSQFRDGGRDTAMGFTVTGCSLGRLLVAASARGVTAILIGDDDGALVAELRRAFPNAELDAAPDAFASLVADVVRLVERPCDAPDLPLDIRGTAFQHRVWQALAAIPVGETVTYADVARRIGAPRAVRAVARACAANTLAVAIPCHRVVRSDGGLSGYRWGIDRKRALLDREKP